MFAVNYWSTDDKRFYQCDNEATKNLLLNKGFSYISRKQINGKHVWLFAKTQELLAALKGGE